MIAALRGEPLQTCLRHLVLRTTPPPQAAARRR
jgi:hypothetical protein